MLDIAPNVSILIGKKIAAKIIAATNGIKGLA